MSEVMRRTLNESAIITKARRSARGVRGGKAHAGRTHADRAREKSEIQDYLSRNPRPWAEVL